MSKGGILVDFSSLAEPVTEQPPCGPDCEYEGDFLALSQAATGKTEQQFGDTVIAAVEPEWRSVEKMASELLGRTKDLRVAASLTLAATNLRGVAGFAAGVGLLHQLCDQYWDEVHPRMVIDGDADPYLRINALSAISDAEGVLRALRMQQLVSQPLAISVRDVEMVVGKDAAARYSLAQVQSILSDALKAGSVAIASFEQARSSVSALEQLVDERFGSGESPDFSALHTLFKSVGAAIDHAKPTSEGSSEQTDDEVGGEPGSVRGSQATQGGSGEIRCRDDVKRSLQRVCDYLERYEPSNPAALFARRAQAMLDRNFLDIMLELSPDSMQHLQMLTGAKLPEE
jgi:type VI secretion system protein ImpA